MKKIKYLLCAFIFGLGLLINHSFGIDIELIDSPSESQYLVQFFNNGICEYGNCNHTYNYMTYNYQYYFGYYFNSYTYGNYWDCGYSDCPVVDFNNSITSVDLYSSDTYHYTSSNRKIYNYQIFPGFPSGFPQVLLGQQQSLGLVFVCPDCFNQYSSPNPKFKIGQSFYGSYENVKIVNSSESNYIRLLNEFDTGFDVSNLDFITGSGFPVSSWQYFTPLQSRTNYGRIATPGYSFGRLGSPIGLGFSSVYTLDTSNTGSVSYKNFKFRTYYDTIIVPLKLMSGNNQYILLDSDLEGFFIDGVLVLPANSYSSGESLGEFVIAKDLVNKDRILYESYSCINNIYPFVDGTSCYKVDAGYLTYNGSKSVLPFDDSDTEYSISSSPLLQDLTYFRVSTTTDSNGFKIGSHYYGFESDLSVDILSSIQEEFPSYSGSGSLIDDCVNTEVCWYEDDIRYCTDRCLSSGVISSGSFVGNDGTIYYVNSDLNIDNLINGNDDLLFDPTYIDSGGFLTVDYYAGLFDGSGFKLGVCPYPQSNFLSFVSKLRIGNFYPFMPLNCFVSAFQQGVKIHYFDDFGLFPDIHSQLLNGDSHYHRTLFRFFDLLLSIGLLLILSSLHRLVKK